MKTSFVTVSGTAAVAALAALLFMPAAQAGGNSGSSGHYWTYPSIAQYGRTHPVPKAHVRPKKDRVYKAIFDVTKGLDKPSEPNAGLEHVARAVNVFVMAGVPLRNLKFVAVLHGGATTAVLNNAAYKAKYGVDNPNIGMLDALHKA